MKKSKIEKAILAVLVCIFLSEMLIAAPEKAVDPNYLPNLMGDILIGVGSVIILGVLVSLTRFSFMLLEFQKNRILIEQGIKIPKPIVKAPLFDRIYDWAVALKPMEQEQDILLDHDYDGIKELDNSLPPWWLAMFYITVVIAGGYWGYYEYYDYGLSSGEAYVQEMKKADAIKAAFLERQANLVNESNIEPLVDLASIENGKAIFDMNCAACHGMSGEGGVGPNLTDPYWLHGADIKSIFKTIKYGVPEKGMISWKAQLRPSDMHQVSSYILTLKGTKPANGKAPQGKLFVEKNEGGAIDSLKTLGMR